MGDRGRYCNILKCSSSSDHAEKKSEIVIVFFPPRNAIENICTVILYRMIAKPALCLQQGGYVAGYSHEPIIGS